MKQQTELTVRMLLKSDTSVTEEDIEKAVNILKGKEGGDASEELEHVIKRKDVLKLLGVHRRTLDYYVEQGYLKRVYGIGKRAIGISRDSFLKFTAQRAAGSLGAVRKEGGASMTKCEFWCRLRELERKYDKKTKSPVRRRLVWIDGWASSLMDGWPARICVPRWLCNELKHVEEGLEVGGGVPGTQRELPPIYADLMFHGVLSPRPWGGTVLPSNFVLGNRLGRRRAERKTRIGFAHRGIIMI